MLYWTVTDTDTAWESLPEVAVMVTRFVPAGVPALAGPEFPQDATNATEIARTAMAMASFHELWRLRASHRQSIPTKLKIVPVHRPGVGIRTAPNIIPVDGRAVVDNCSTVAPSCAPFSVTFAGTNAHPAPAGSLPQANETVCVEPPSGMTLRLTTPVCPAVMVSTLGLAETLKSTPPLTICINTGDVLAR